MSSFFGECLVHCPICVKEMDWMQGYGSKIRCCSRDCYEVFEKRYCAALHGKSFDKKVVP